MSKIIPILCMIISSNLFSSTPSIEELTTQATQKLESIHSKLRLVHGSLSEEYPEQLMATMYLPSDAKVLELGGNIGRNSCVIAAILDDSRNLVTMEPNIEYINDLQENRDCNGLQFHIEASAVSMRPLIQLGWDTFPSEEILPGYSRVSTINFEQLQKKYGIIFDTLVVDCEGALFYILQDDPKILTNIKLVIVENDYHDPQQLKDVSDLFSQNGLQLVYNRSLGYTFYNSENFYQVWKK